MTKPGLEPNFANMGVANFDSFFQGEARDFLLWNIRLALAEDGADLTGRAIFVPEHRSEAVIVAKQDSLLAGLPIVPITLAEAEAYEAGEWSWEPLALEGSSVKNRDQVARIEGNTRLLLKAERVILNYIMQLSGVANLTALYARELEGAGSRLLDTRKTCPGLRYPQKYAVRVGGGLNHRLGLDKMLL
ncbi:MAG: nicotinate-nucleotide diphosphorylase (carboxylating), partial [Desulfovibrionaceae bacterium]|nr:nicotinate-nucleotide diphosphorylase (carboxylating) [Desulfovibrionaceae bacterium]